MGAEVTLDASRLGDDVPARVIEATEGGAHLSLDAFGSPGACVASVRSLRKRGRHVQVGLLPPSDGVPAIPMDAVLSRELEILGSHGMAAHAYPGLLDLVSSGLLRPDLLVTLELTLDEAGEALATLGSNAGISVVSTF
jgi:alcohol dehydrogenase